MSYVPSETQVLCVSCEFDLTPTGLGAAHFTALDPNEAVRMAVTGLKYDDLKPEQFSAKLSLVDDASYPAVKQLPFQPQPTPVHYEFFVDNNKRISCRGRTDLTIIDGFTASRHMFAAIEAMEGGMDASKITDSPAFKVPNPEPTVIPGSPEFAANHAKLASTLKRSYWKQLLLLPLTAARTVVDRILPGFVPKRGNVPGPLGFDIWKLRKGSPAGFRLFNIGKGVPYRKVVTIYDKFRSTLGLDGFFALMNYRGKVAATVVYDGNALVGGKDARMAGVITPITAPPPALFEVHRGCSHLLFTNNYGSHQLSVKATPVAFSWDWLNLPPLAGAVIITINGTTFLLLRVPQGGDAALKSLVKKELGGAVETAWPSISHYSPSELY